MSPRLGMSTKLAIYRATGSQLEIARRLGVSTMTVANYKTGAGRNVVENYLKEKALDVRKTRFYEPFKDGTYER